MIFVRSGHENINFADMIVQRNIFMSNHRHLKERGAL